MALRDDVILRFGGDSRGVNKTLGDIRASIGGLGRIAGTLGLGFGAASLVRSLGESVIALDAMERGFTAVTGSQKASAMEMEYIAEVADRLGLELLSTADAYLSLMAAAKGTTLEGKEARRIFEAVSSAMSKLGKSAADTQGALLAVQQMISKGKVSAEELRGQLTERLPGAFQAAARAMGVTTAKLGEMLQSGNIVAEDLLPKLAAELEKTGNSGERVDSLTASMNRLKNAMTSFGGALKPLIVGAVDGLSDLVAEYGRFGIILSHLASGELVSLDQVRAWEEQTKASIKAAREAAENAAKPLPVGDPSGVGGPSKEFQKYLDDQVLATKSASELELEIWKQYGAEARAIRKGDAEAAAAAQKAQEDAFKALGKAGASDITLNSYKRLVGEIEKKPVKMPFEMSIINADGAWEMLAAGITKGGDIPITVAVTPKLVGENQIAWGPDLPAEVDKTGANP